MDPGHFVSKYRSLSCGPQEFQKCGDMLQFGTFGAVSRCNWIYIQYQARPRSLPVMACLTRYSQVSRLQTAYIMIQGQINVWL